MKRLLLLLSIFISTANVLYGQETNLSEPQQHIASYLDSNGTMGQYEFAYDQLLKMLENQFPKQENNTKGWTYLTENRTKAISDIKMLLIPIYEDHFTPSEIDEMLAFYTSDTGKQLLNDRTQLTEEQQQALNKFYGGPTGKKIVEKQPALTQEIAKASEEWSRDLYETALSLLKDE